MLNKKLLQCFSTLKKGGNVYTWGSQTSSLGYPVSKAETKTVEPKILTQFPHNVIKCDMGYYHSAIMTEDKQLHTFGSNGKGQLGHNDQESLIEPKLINYFKKNNLEVVDVNLGQEFSMALTSDGDVWTWGFGGRNWNFIMKLFANSTGPLGHGDVMQRHTPTPVEYLRKFDPITQIACGYKFCNALNNKKELYNWGIGEYGVFGHGGNTSYSKPFLNDYFEHWQKTEGMEIVKIKSANQYSMALMNDGKLYGWGCNEFGQMGIKNEIGVEIYETANYPVAVNLDEVAPHAKIVDFAVGENIVGILLDNNEVYWSGKKIAYRPERLQLPKDIGKIKLIGASHHSVVVVDENNKIYFIGDYMQAKEVNDRTGVSFTDSEAFGGGNILEIGGTYQNKFAIVDNSSQ